MKSAKAHLFIVILFAFLSITGTSQQRSASYTDYDQGYYYYYYNKWDSAFLFFNRYINNADDVLKKAKAFTYMGEIQTAIGDLYGAQESLMGTIQTLNKPIEAHAQDIGFAYNLLGNVSLNLKQYDEAIHFYNNASIFFKGSEYLLEVMNGKATAFQKKGRYQQAIALYDSILALKPGEKERLARIIDNRAQTKLLADPAYNALPEFQSALKIRADSQYSMGLNASYAHLSDYYSKSKQDSALWYANKMLEKAKENQSPDDILEAIDKLILLNSTADGKEYWYAAFRKLDDSLQLSRDTTRNRFALIRYDVQKSKADNLVLQQHITKQRIGIYGLIVMATLIIAGIYFKYQKRKKRIRRETEMAIRDARLKTSQKVHDVVANGLYGIMNGLEHGKEIDMEPLMTKIEGLYEQSRNISYEDFTLDSSPHYDTQVHYLLTAFANEQTKVLVVGNQPKFWNKITGLQKQELQLILNEIMVNMKKHSHAKNVAIIFRADTSQGIITYKDDGVGLPPGFTFGNGLHNTVCRSKAINGAITFGKSGKAGVSIEISFPLEQGKI